MIDIHPPAYTHRPRTQPPRIIIIHATRGETTQALQYQATVNWFRSSSGAGGQRW